MVQTDRGLIDRNTLSPESIQELGNCLLNAMIYCANSPAFVTSKFCQAIAAFMIHAAPDHWPEPLNSLRLTVEENRARQGFDLLFLEFLSVIVEQVRKSQLAKEKRCFCTWLMCP